MTVTTTFFKMLYPFLFIIRPSPLFSLFSVVWPTQIFVLKKTHHFVNVHVLIVHDILYSKDAQCKLYRGMTLKDICIC